MRIFTKLFLLPAMLCFFSAFDAYSQDSPINASESALCESVDDYAPQNIKSSFPNNVGRVYYWTKITGAEKPSVITHQWFYENKMMVEVPLNILNENHRTWSYKTIMPEWIGNWKVKTADSDGNILDEKSFVIGKDSNAKSYEQDLSTPPEELIEEKGIELKFGSAVNKCEILGNSESFAGTIGRVYCWTLLNTDNAPTSIKHVWYYKDRIMSEITLRIKYPRTRTWSYKTILPEQSGKWSVKVFDASDNLLESSEFEIK